MAKIYLCDVCGEKTPLKAIYILSFSSILPKNIPDPHRKEICTICMDKIQKFIKESKQSAKKK